MKTVYTKFITAVALSTTLLTPMARAEIPFSQAHGMLTNTQEDKKDFSPFWAMVAVHGKMLESIRFYGNYSTSDKINNFGVHFDIPNDPIAGIIQALFSSPDGVQFVASTTTEGPAKNLSQNLGKINDIIEILLKPIESVQESPEIVGMESEKKRLELELENLNKQLMELSTKQPKREKIEKNPQELEIIQNIQDPEEKKQRSIEAKERHQLKVNEAEIHYKTVNDKFLKEKKDFLEKIKIQENSMNAIKKTILEFKKSKNIVTSTPEQRLADRKKSQIEEITKILDSITVVKLLTPFDLDEEANKNIYNKNRKFAADLVGALEAEKIYANQKDNPTKYLYPKNIVITALLSFFIKIADDKKELEKLPFLMKEGALYPPDFDEKEYSALKQDLGSNFPPIQLLNNPELSFLMSKGYEAYEYAYVQPINYRGDAPFGNATFPDCGETSLRNVLGIFLSAKNKGTVQTEVLQGLRNKLKKLNPGLQFEENSPFNNLQKFFQTNPDMIKGATEKVHGEWAKVVSNLNNNQRPQTLNDVRYGRSIANNYINIYEIKSAADSEVKGIVNMFNVIAKLIPDQVLNEQWSSDRGKRLKQVSTKLDRLCELLSREGLILSWKNESTGDKNITNEIMNIVFINEELPIFVWRFKLGHFLLDPVVASERDWRVSYQTVDEDNFQNEWMASLYLKLNEEQFIDNKNYAIKYPLSLIFTPEIRSVEGAIKTLSFVVWKNDKDKALTQFQSLMTRWIDKSIPLNDNQSLDKISLLLYAVNHFDFITKILQNTKYTSIQKEVENIMKQQPLDPDNLLQKAANYGFNTALIYISGKPDSGIELNLDLANYNSKHLIFTDITLKNLSNLRKIEYLMMHENSTITNEGLKNLSNLTFLGLQENSTITNEGLKNLPNLTSLSLSHNSKITNEGLKNLPNLTSLNLSSNSTITNEGLKNLPNLTSLNLSHNSMITNEGLKNLPNLTSLNLSSNSTITNVGLNLPNLTSLNLSSNSTITNVGLNLPNLTSLDLTFNSTITNKGFVNLGKLTHLNLNFNKTITDQGLMDLKKLTHLNLSSNETITDQGLVNHRNLISLNLSSNSKITNNGLYYICLNSQKFTSLNINNNTMISDSFFDYCKKLTTLSLIENNKITTQGIENFKKINPNIKIIGR